MKRLDISRNFCSLFILRKANLCFLLLCAFVSIFNRNAYAIPPLVAGDVPTADKHHLEWFIGTRYQKTGSIERQVPFTELVYGISDRQEVTAEMPYLSIKGQRGAGDAVLGTKYHFLSEEHALIGAAGSLEVKLDNGNRSKELGSGAMDYDLRLRFQKTWQWFTGIANAGYTFVGEPKVDGIRQKRRDVLFFAFAQEYKITERAKLLSEIYWKNSDEPHVSHRFAGDVGFKYQLLPNIAIHAAIGKSLREGNLGGPRLRVYAGMKIEFP